MKKVIYDWADIKLRSDCDLQYQIMNTLGADYLCTYYYAVSPEFKLVHCPAGTSIYHLSGTSIIFEKHTAGGSEPGNLIKLTKITLVGSEKDIGEVERKILDVVEECKSQEKNDE